jgi:hypothetical protein
VASDTARAPIASRNDAAGNKHFNALANSSSLPGPEQQTGQFILP